MKTWKKVLIFGVVCYAGYKLGQKYLEENDMTARDVLHKAQTKAKDAAAHKKEIDDLNALWYDPEGTWDAVHAQAAELDRLIDEFNAESGVLDLL